MYNLNNILHAEMDNLSHLHYYEIPGLGAGKEAF